MIDMFSMFLEGLSGWGIGKIMDTLTGCPSCGQRDNNRIGNVQQNYIECSNCHVTRQQFTNACDFTVNRTTHEIGHAIFESGQYAWQWVDESRFFEARRDRLRIPFNIRIKGLRGRAVVFVTEMRRYNDDKLITFHSSVLTPAYDNSSWADYWHSFAPSKFPNEDRGIIAIDAKVLSEYRDVLFEDRRIVQPWK